MYIKIPSTIISLQLTVYIELCRYTILVHLHVCIHMYTDRCTNKLCCYKPIGTHVYVYWFTRDLDMGIQCDNDSRDAWTHNYAMPQLCVIIMMSKRYGYTHRSASSPVQFTLHNSCYGSLITYRIYIINDIECHKGVSLRSSQLHMTNNNYSPSIYTTVLACYLVSCYDLFSCSL